MGCRILVGKGDNKACFYCSVTDVVFGVLLRDWEEAQSFEEWVDVDLRTLTHEEFVTKLNKFRERDL